MTTDKEPLFIQINGVTREMTPEEVKEHEALISYANRLVIPDPD